MDLWHGRYQEDDISVHEIQQCVSQNIRISSQDVNKTQPFVLVPAFYDMEIKENTRKGEYVPLIPSSLPSLLQDTSEPGIKYRASESSPPPSADSQDTTVAH